MEEGRLVETDITDLVIAGWTGRDPEAVEAHIAELEALDDAFSERVIYQEGPVSALRPPEDLIGRYKSANLPTGTALFGGTLAVRGSVRPSARFEFELEDPVLKRKTTHGYTVRTLPTVE